MGSEMCIRDRNAIPIFIDSEKDSWNMCPVLLEEAINDRINKSIRHILMLVLLDILSWSYMKNQTKIMTSLYISGI